MEDKIFGKGWNQDLPQMEDNIQTLCKVSCLGTVACLLSRTSIKMKWHELLTFV